MKNFFNKKFSTKTKLISSAISLMLIVCFAITGTVAWLIDTSGPVEDTFTFGKVDIELIDGIDDDLWSKRQQARLDVLTENATANKLIPGQTIDFDPMVKVLEGSEDCYIFVKITTTESFNNAFAGYAVNATNWKLVPGQTGVYYYANANSNLQKMTAGGKTASVITNGEITVNGTNVTNSFSATDVEFEITAYAIQSKYLTPDNTVPTPEAAWDLINN